MASAIPSIRIKRVYAAAEAEDGARVLVDRLWPRGISKARAALDLWFKEIAPSPGLRAWFHQDSAHWPAFAERYRAELDRHPAAVEQLAEFARKGRLTLIYAAHDPEHNHALVLADYLRACLAEA